MRIFNQLLAAQVTLPGKVHRQYLTRGLNASQRAQAIISHYQFVDSLGASRLAGGHDRSERCAAA
ncbi:DUF535 family protein [Klebsiella michiganensis]|uniref:DUF535 family protein n=1 Tax=Klebsiella michiganensis TaxID=1134687 RepID=UPI000A90B09E|nr:DUF535 family protein [Klebsiella michiganensis]